MRAAVAPAELETNQPPAPARQRRSHTFHRPWRIWIVSLLFVVFGVSFAAFLTAAIALPVVGQRWIGIAALACAFISVVSRLAAFVLSRDLHCGLCHGTVMSEKRCRKHADAVRLRPLGYRATAVLSVLFTLSFRCMYCGTRFKLWK